MVLHHSLRPDGRWRPSATTDIEREKPRNVIPLDLGHHPCDGRREPPSAINPERLFGPHSPPLKEGIGKCCLFLVQQSRYRVFGIRPRLHAPNSFGTAWWVARCAVQNRASPRCLGFLPSGQIGLASVPKISTGWHPGAVVHTHPLPTGVNPRAVGRRETGQVARPSSHKPFLTHLDSHSHPIPP